MEIIIRHSAPSCRGLASPKTGVGVWRLVLIVCLPFLGQIACFWWGMGGGRAGGVGLCGRVGLSPFVLAYARRDISGWLVAPWADSERRRFLAACTGRLAQSIPRAGGRAGRNFDWAKDHLLAGLSEWRIRISSLFWRIERFRERLSLQSDYTTSEPPSVSVLTTNARLDPISSPPCGPRHRHLRPPTPRRRRHLRHRLRRVPRRDIWLFGCVLVCV